MAVCSVEDCRRSVYVKKHGLCSRHYHRWKAHGDPLGGSTSIGDARKFFDEVVVGFPGDECLIWPFSRDNHGYGQLRHEGRPWKVSRLACVAVHGAPPRDKREAAHSCGGGLRGCVNPNHLRWASRQENMNDKERHGTLLFCERAPRSILTDSQVREIRSLRGSASQRHLATRFGVSRWTIASIFNGRNWARLEA